MTEHNGATIYEKRKAQSLTLQLNIVEKWGKCYYLQKKHN